jgi:hypothetical protein
LARLCTLDLGQEITRAEVHAFILCQYFPARLTADEQNDMFATVIKELDRIKSEGLPK